MFTWIVNQWRRRQRRKQRAVFRFFDGQRMRAVDPFVAYRQLDTHPRFKWEHLAEIDDGDEDAAETTIAAAREVFGLPAFDGTDDALTAAEVLDVLTEFGRWLEDVKKKSPPTSTRSSPTGGPSSTTPGDPTSTTSFSSAAT